jgi:hypothetical protein
MRARHASSCFKERSSFPRRVCTAVPPTVFTDASRLGGGAACKAGQLCIELRVCNPTARPTPPVCEPQLVLARLLDVPAPVHTLACGSIPRTRWSVGCAAKCRDSAWSLYCGTSSMTTVERALGAAVKALRRCEYKLTPGASSLGGRGRCRRPSVGQCLTKLPSGSGSHQRRPVCACKQTTFGVTCEVKGIQATSGFECGKV